MNFPLPSVALLLALSAAAGAEAARTREVPPATPAGSPVDCIQRNRIRETRVRDDRTIDFYMIGNKVYRNRLPQSCPQLGFEQSFGYKTALDQLCSVDIITVLRRTGRLEPGASCGLGSFQPVTGVGR